MNKTCNKGFREREEYCEQDSWRLNGQNFSGPQETGRILIDVKEEESSELEKQNKQRYAVILGTARSPPCQK